MTSQDPRPGDQRPAVRSLRQRAEEVARLLPGEPLENGRLPSGEELRDTLHELRVHQIELEMQNENLRQSQGALAAGSKHLRLPGSAG